MNKSALPLGISAITLVLFLGFFIPQSFAQVEKQRPATSIEQQTFIENLTQTLTSQIQPLVESVSFEIIASLKVIETWTPTNTLLIQTESANNDIAKQRLQRLNETHKQRLQDQLTTLRNQLNKTDNASFQATLFEQISDVREQLFILEENLESQTSTQGNTVSQNVQKKIEAEALAVVANLTLSNASETQLGVIKQTIAHTASTHLIKEGTLSIQTLVTTATLTNQQTENAKTAPDETTQINTETPKTFTSAITSTNSIPENNQKDFAELMSQLESWMAELMKKLPKDAIPQGIEPKHLLLFVFTVIPFMLFIVIYGFRQLQNPASENSGAQTEKTDVIVLPDDAQNKVKEPKRADALSETLAEPVHKTENKTKSASEATSPSQTSESKYETMVTPIQPPVGGQQGHASTQPFFEGLDEAQIVSLLSDESLSDQVLLLQCCKPAVIADYLSTLADDTRARLFAALSQNTTVPTDVLQSLERRLRFKLRCLGNPNPLNEKELDNFFEIIDNADETKTKALMKTLRQHNLVVYHQIKQYFCRFADIRRLPEKYVKPILNNIKIEYLAITLELCDDAIKQFVFDNLSPENQQQLLRMNQEMPEPEMSVKQNAKLVLIQNIRNFFRSNHIKLLD